MLSRPLLLTTLSIVFSSLVPAQISTFPYIEKFDTVITPKLPSGWITSASKSPAGDFTTTTSTPNSVPNAVVSTDARVPQSLISPPFNFAERVAGSLEFHERRTSTHNAGLLVEAFLGGDTSSAIPITDTLKNPGNMSYVLRSVQLPPALNDQPEVRFRWRVVGNGTGAAGTLRIDDVVITVQKITDLAITEMHFEPEVVRAHENLTVHVGVTNRGIGGIRSFVIRLFDDKNLDSLVSSAEEIDRQVYTGFLASAESSVCILHYPAIAPGSHRVIAELFVPGDEDTSNNTGSKTILVGSRQRAVLVNEIMYAPAAGPEWIECINTSRDTLSLSQWKIGDNSTNRTVITSLARILPRQFFIIAKDSSIFLRYPSIPAPVLNASFPTLNNDADAVVLVDPVGGTIDSVAYIAAWGGTSGRSLERIDTAENSNDASNWASSHDPQGATPGVINSVSRKEFDLSVERMEVFPILPIANQLFELIVTIRNRGRQPIARHMVYFFLDANLDSIPQPSEFIGQESLPSVLGGDSEKVLHSMVLPAQGEHRLGAVVVSDHDDDTLNNIKTMPIAIGVEQRSMILNEIMYAPPGDMPEWIECYNASSGSIDVAGWKISDANTRTKTAFAFSRFVIEPGRFFVVTTDSSLLNYFPIRAPLFVSRFSSLNNATPDAVVLFDGREVMMDSVLYKPSWGGANGSSLERIDCFASSGDSANWKSSLPTPGAENSVAKKDHDIMMTKGSTRSVSDGVVLTATVLNAGRQRADGVKVSFFWDANADSIGSEQEALRVEEGLTLLPGDSLVVEFEWKTKLGGRLPILFRADYPPDERPSNNSVMSFASNHFAAGAAIINEILYEPAAQYSEFIELYNRSRDTIDMQQWRIMDAPSAAGNRAVVQFPSFIQQLPPNNYFIIAADSSFFSQFPSLRTSFPGNIFITNKDLSLNNGGDDIVLVDQTGAEIDSVHYVPSWHNPSLNTSVVGKSLERINPWFESNDKRNWSTSVDVSGATPLRRNSVFTAALPSAASLTLSPNPFSPDNDGFEDFLAIAYTLPSAASMIRVRCFDVQGRLVCTIANNEPAASTGTIFWNGRDDQDQRVRIGMYIILFEALDVAGGVVRVMKDVAVVTTRL